MARPVPHDAPVELPRPTWRTVAPFLTVGSLGLASAVLPPHNVAGGELWAMVSLFAVMLGFLLVSLARTRRSWVDPAVPVTFLLALTLARDGTGGANSEITGLIVLPIVWLAMTGTRRQLVVMTGLVAAFFLVPTLVIGAPHYPIGDWHRPAFWVAVAALVAPVIHRKVEHLARETTCAREANAEMAGIMQGARLSSMISTEVDGRIRSFSRGAEDLLGYRAADLIRQHTPGLFHDPDEVVAVAEELGVEPGFAVFAELARLEAPSRIWTYIRADGAKLYVRLAVTDLRDDRGRVTGYLGVAIDTTETVEAEKALARSESLLRVLLDHLPDLTVMMIGEDRRIRAVAGTGAMRQGMHGSEGKLLSEVSNATNSAIVTPLLEEAFAGRASTGQLNATANGAEHEIVVTPLPPEPDGARVLVVARNVSEERTREREVMTAKERAERLFADAPHGVAVLTPDGTVLQVNGAMLAISGIAESEVLGHKLAGAGTLGGVELERHLADVMAAAGASIDTPWSLHDIHGRQVYVDLSSRALLGEAGADDVVLVNVVDVSERHRYEQRLAHLADHDVLTGLANRRRFDERLTEHLERCERYGPTGALLLLDLDNFKEVNDTLGHGAGDQLIISTAALLAAGVRSTDVVARLGGDEFAILLTDGDRDAAETVARSVVERVREYTATLDGTRRRVTASVGVVTLQAAREHAADLLALADMTMYDAKDAGRDRYIVLEEETQRQPRLGARLEWKGRIEHALENEGFALHLQPILNLHTNVVESAEVLIRLHDDDELVLPSTFLHIAERSGLMPRVDAWVLSRSVAMLARLRQVDPAFRLEVNLSGHSIGNAAIESVIVSSLHEHDVDPSALVLEITETAAVADVELARQFAERMTSLGCQFALDDFGAGFGSFYYLKHLLFDYVKIDGEFVANCHHSSIDRTILRSIVGIARDLGKRTVAEFVSEPAILDVVREEGVDLAQGYLVGKPVPYDDFVARFLTAGVAPGDRRAAADRWGWAGSSGPWD